MRNLTKSEIRERFNEHKKLHKFEVDKLFKKKNLTDEQYRWLCKGYRNVLVFDIEAIQFDVRMGFMICWYGLKWDLLTNKTCMLYDKLTVDDMESGYKDKDFNFDKRILQTLLDTMKKSDIVAGHYISKFDIPYITARCHITKQDDLVPNYMDCRIVDTWKITKNKYNLYNSGGNSLRNTGFILNGQDSKTSVDLNIWKTMYWAKHPKWKKCRKYICDHCEIDVYQNFEVLKKEIKRVPVGGASI